jgi:hypothetical protein
MSLSNPGEPPRTPAPSAREVESALRELLRRNHFTRTEQVSVLSYGQEFTPIYMLTLSSEAAPVLRDLLIPLLGTRTQPSATEWVLFRPDADAILKAIA